MGLGNRHAFCVFAEPQSLFRSNRNPQAFMCGVDEYHANYFLGISQCEVSRNRATVGVSDEQEWAGFAKFCECVVEFEIDLREGTRLRAGVAPTVPGAVVGADAGKGRELFLNEYPIERIVAQAVLYDYGGTALSRAMDVELMSAEINQCARRRWGRG